MDSASRPKTSTMHADAAALSLLSLARAPQPVVAIEIDMSTDMDMDTFPPTHNSHPSPTTLRTHRHASSGGSSSGGSSSKLNAPKRRERRLSDARDAAQRPTISMIGSPPGLSMASLSLSTSNTTTTPFLSSSPRTNATSRLIKLPTARPIAMGMSKSVPPSLMLSNDRAKMEGKGGSGEKGNAEKGSANGKGEGEAGRKGVDHKCESCSKIYRHPSCLIKHRWEHTPHWRAASTHVCSKHQQVQLLEAAAILSHLSRDPESALPEDRSLWPSFCGSLPPPGSVSTPSSTGPPAAGIEAFGSSSVPGRTVHTVGAGPRGSFNAIGTSPSRAPRMHDYALDSRITMVRPGVLGVATDGSSSSHSSRSPGSSLPISIAGHTGQRVNVHHQHDRASYYNHGSSSLHHNNNLSGGSMNRNANASRSISPSKYAESIAAAAAASTSPSSHRGPTTFTSTSLGSTGGIGAWALPSSSLRSGSVVSNSSSSGGGLSRSSGSPSDGDDDEEFDDGEQVRDEVKVASVESGSLIGRGYGTSSSPLYQYSYNSSNAGGYEDKYGVPAGSARGHYGFASRARGRGQFDIIGGPGIHSGGGASSTPRLKQEQDLNDFEMEMDGQMDAGADGHLRSVQHPYQQHQPQRQTAHHHQPSMKYQNHAYSLREEDEDDGDDDHDVDVEGEDDDGAIPRLTGPRRGVAVVEEQFEMDLE